MRVVQKILWNCYFFIAFALITFIVVIISPVVIPINMAYRSISIGSAMRRGICFYGWLLVRKVPFFAPVKVIYQGKKIPKKSIFVANHNSAIDPYLFGAIPVETGFVTSWPFKIPLYKYFMGIAGFANAEKGWQEVFEKSEIMLDEGCHVIIWPEGHRSRDRQISRFKSGAFQLAFETGTPIVPVCIIGSGDIMAPGERFLSCGKVTLVVLDPVYPEDKTNRRDDVQQLRRHVQAKIKETLTEYGHFD